MLLLALFVYVVVPHSLERGRLGVVIVIVIIVTVVVERFRHFSGGKFLALKPTT